MIIQCNSCEKKFNVPDGAITDSGRLVQCSSCGNKWTQHPIKTENNELPKKNNKPKTAISTLPKKKKSKKIKNTSLYTRDYLKNKHGIKIIDPTTAPIIDPKNSLTKTNFGFYNTVITLLVFFITFFGVINLTDEIIIAKYPFLENYINYLFETLNNLKLIFEDFIRSY